MPTTVVNIKTDEYDIYGGRGGIWGNPFIIGKDGTREEVVAKHREWFLTQSQLIARLPEIKDKKLGCFCAPKPCHCDNLAGFADGLIPIILPTPPKKGRIIEVGCGTKVDIGQQ